MPFKVSYIPAEGRSLYGTTPSATTINNTTTYISGGGGGGTTGATYTPGANIDISNSNVISVTGINSSYIVNALGFTPISSSSTVSNALQLSGISANYYAKFEDLADVATSGSYTDLRDKPTIPTSLPWSAITNKPTFATVATSGDYDDLENKPELATVATSGSYNDLSNKPTIPTQTSQLTNNSGFITSSATVSNANQLGGVGYAYYAKFEDLADVATSGEYSDLKGKPTIPTTMAWSAITNKPTFATVATSGDYDDLENKPELATVATSGSYNDLSNKPTIPTKTSQLTNNSGFITTSATVSNSNQLGGVGYAYYAKFEDLADVATSGEYSDLKGKPTIPTTMAWSAITNKPTFATVATSGDYDDLENKPELATVATSGSYNDLSNKPTIPTQTSQLTNNSGFITSASTVSNANQLGGVGASNYAQFGDLADVATSGEYSDLKGKPTIPTTMAWSAITNKPTFADVATSGDYDDLENKPTIPTQTSQLTNNSGFITASATVANSTKWNGYKIVVNGSGTASDTIYFFT